MSSNGGNNGSSIKNTSNINNRKNNNNVITKNNGRKTRGKNKRRRHDAWEEVRSNETWDGVLGGKNGGRNGKKNKSKNKNTMSLVTSALDDDESIADDYNDSSYVMTIADRIRSKRQRAFETDSHSLSSRRVVRDMMRYLYLVLDLSGCMYDKDPDLNMSGGGNGNGGANKTRLEATLNAIRLFVDEYHDQNPLGQLGIVACRHGEAEVLCAMGGGRSDTDSTLAAVAMSTPDDPIFNNLSSSTNNNNGGKNGGKNNGINDTNANTNATTTVADARSFGGFSLQNGIETALKHLLRLPPHGAREILLVVGSLQTCDPGEVLIDTLPSLLDNTVRVSCVSLCAEMHVVRKVCESTGGVLGVCMDGDHLRDLVLRTAVPPPSRGSSSSDANRIENNNHDDVDTNGKISTDDKNDNDNGNAKTSQNEKNESYDPKETNDNDSNNTNKNNSNSNNNKSRSYETTFILMGFPKRLAREHPTLVHASIPNPSSSSQMRNEGCQLSFVRTGFVCPRCMARSKEVPADCGVCGLRLILSTHLARSFHHLFPVPPFVEMANDNDIKCNDLIMSNGHADGIDKATNNQQSNKYKHPYACPSSSLVLPLPPILSMAKPPAPTSSSSVLDPAVGGNKRRKGKDEINTNGAAAPILDVEPSILVSSRDCDTCCFSCLKSIGNTFGPPSPGNKHNHTIISAANSNGSDGTAESLRFQCPSCLSVFCADCDAYLHGRLHNCPGCLRC